MFTERDAIQFELEELKEQARRDDDLYLTIRERREDRLTVLMDRLRALDSKPVDSKPIPVDNVTNEPDMIREKNVFMPLSQRVKLEKETKLQEHVRKEKLSKNKRKKRIPYERVTTVVLDYLSAFEGDQPSMDIQAFVEEELETKWTNFSNVMKWVMKINPNIKSSDRFGHYYLDTKEELK